MMGTAKKLAGNIAVIIILSVCLLVTTFALSVASVSAENNEFKTGKVSINLNDGQPVISENEFVFEPGMRVEKAFFVENTGTCDVWYRLYFTNVSGGLADVLDVTVCDSSDNVLYSGKMSDLCFDEDDPPEVTDKELAVGEKRDLKILFCYPESMTSETAGEYVCFDIIADATQKQNNPEKQFE